jgi:endonuclease/exonuclease/phosphatase (EEP) superfamily protein YafD
MTGVLLNRFVAPAVFVLPSFLSIAFPFLLIINVLCCLFWLILKQKKRAFIFVLITLIFVNPARRWVNFSFKTEEKSNLKIVTFNVFGGRKGIDKIENFINRQNTDIVCIQEGGPAERFEFKNLPVKTENHTVRVYSKHRIVKQEMWNIEYIRFGQYTDIEIHGKIYRIINVYLQPFYLKQEILNNIDENENEVKNILLTMSQTFKAHEIQLKTITDCIEKSLYPVIVCGDFNAVPNSYEYFQITKNLNDAFLKAGNGAGTSFHGLRIPLRLDYIFYSDELKPINYKVDKSVKISDHYPVITEFKTY